MKDLIRTGICVFLLMALLQSCGKFRTGKIDYKVKYTTDKSSVKSSEANSD